VALAGALIPALERLVGPARPPYWPPWQRIAELCLLVAAYACTVVLEDVPAVVTAALLGLLAIRLTVRPLPGDWAYALIGAVAGPAVEATLSAAGAFDYAGPDVAGIPMWLPALWANGGLFIRRLLGPIVRDD
jgi:hypothetical protein